MGKDDDADCPAHQWETVAVIAGPRGADLSQACKRCGGVRLKLARRDVEAARPSLDAGEERS